MFKRVLVLCVVSFFTLPGCSSFSELTAIGPDSTDGPKASDCGSCHVSQFKEWSLSRHAFGYRDKIFQAEYKDGGDEDCLICHAPMLVRTEDPIPRPYDRAGGVDCVSCHFSEGKMHGPHALSALFKPHPVEEKDQFYLGVSICAGCHGETADEYGEAAEKDSSMPTCLECHSTPVRKTASQGTNFFSDTLVFFEDTVETRSHEISLAAQVIESGLIPLEVTYLQDESEKIVITITNNLPHNLPTGTFGQKSVKLVITFSHEDENLEQTTVLVADEVESLTPGMSKKIHVKTPSLLQTGDRMDIHLKRFGDPADCREPVVLAGRSVDVSAGI